MVEGTPPGDAPPPPPQRATPAHKGARCGAGAGSTRPHQPHPGSATRVSRVGTPAARSRGRAAGGGTAPDTKRPSQRWQATPPGDAPPPPPRHAAPTGHAGRGDSVWAPTPTHPRPQPARGWRTPTARPVGGQSCWGPPPTCCGRGCVGVGAQHCPRGLHALWGLHAAGVVGGRPRGGWPATVVRGAWCQALSLPRPPVLWSGQPGFRDPCVPGAVGAGVWTQHRPHSVRPCGPALLAVGVAEGRPRGGAFHHCEGRLRPGAGGGTATGLRRPSQWWKAPPPGTPSRHPHSEQRRPARAHAMGPVLGPRARTDRTRDTRVGGRCGRGDPAPAPQCAPLRAGVARCGCGGRASPGGVPSTIVGGVWGQAPSLPRLPAHWAGCWGPLPTCCGRGCVGVGPNTVPLACMPCGGCVPRGWWGAVPGGGWPATVVRGAWCQALSLPRPPVLWSGQPGFRDPCVPGAVGAGVGTRHRPHSVRPRGPALLAVGVAEGRPRGGCLPPLWGASEARRRPSPDCPPTGRAVGARRLCAVGAGCGCGGPTRSPRPHRPHPGHTGHGALAARSGGRAAGGGTASDARRPSQWWKHPPPGTPFRHPHSEQRRPARAHVVGPVLGPHARTDRTRDTRVAEPWPPAPEDGRPGEGQRLTPGAPRNGDRPPPRGQPPTTPAACSPHRACRPGGQWRTPTARPIGGQSGEGQRLTPDAPHTMMEGTPPGDAPPPPLQRATHQRTHAPASHGTSAPHPLLLGTATQQWRNPRPYAKHAPDLRRWTRHTRSSGHWDSETATETPHKGTRTRTPTRRKSRGPPREARPRNLRRRRAACPPSAPRGNGATAPAKAGAPSRTLSPAPITGRCPR